MAGRLTDPLPLPATAYVAGRGSSGRHPPAPKVTTVGRERREQMDEIVENPQRPDPLTPYNLNSGRPADRPGHGIDARMITSASP